MARANTAGSRKPASGKPAKRRRPRDRSTLVAASLGLAAIAGGLFTTGALDPVVHDAIALVQKDEAPDDELNAGRVADWMYYEDVPEWSSVRGVPQVSRPSTPDQPVRPAIAPPEHPHRFIFSGPPPMPVYKLEGPDDCMQPHNPVSNVANFVVKATGGGRVTIRWWDMGDPDSTGYELVAVPEYVNQFDYSKPVADPPKKFSSVAAADGCKQMQTSMAGLPAGAKYTFALMSLNTSPLNGRKYSITRATSEVITIK